VRRLELAGIAVEALSVGGIETCIHLPGMRFAFDIGRCPPEVVACEQVLFTHAHMDHMGGVAYHAATRALRHMRPPTYLVPRTDEEAFEGLFAAWRRLDRSELPHATVALAPGEEHALANGLVARPFRSPHTAPCQGYGVWSRRQKLLPELQGLAPEEIRRLRVDEGREVTSAVETPEVAFTGDSRIEVVEREEVVRRARLLILETTFVDDRVSVADCRAKGHVHLDEVAERAELFENEAILMTHFSARYSAREIVAALDARLPASLRERVHPLLPD
jgi:ribonuclease Z